MRVQALYVVIRECDSQSSTRILGLIHLIPNFLKASAYLGPFNQEKLNFRCFFAIFGVLGAIFWCLFWCGGVFWCQIFCVFLVSVVSDLLKTCLMKTGQFFGLCYCVLNWLSEFFFWRQVFLVSGNFLVFVIIFTINFALLLHGNFCWMNELVKSSWAKVAKESFWAWHVLLVLQVAA